VQEDILLRCIFDSLSVFGENTKASLLAKLQEEGVGFTADSFDVEKFSKVLQELLGRSADVIFVNIVHEAGKQLSLLPEQTKDLERAYHQKSHANLLHVLFATAKKE
jgi:hypothetical protein